MNDDKHTVSYTSHDYHSMCQKSKEGSLARISFDIQTKTTAGSRVHLDRQGKRGSGRANVVNY